MRSDKIFFLTYLAFGQAWLLASFFSSGGQRFALIAISTLWSVSAVLGARHA